MRKVKFEISTHFFSVPCDAIWVEGGGGVDDWIRMSKRTGYEIPIPLAASATEQFNDLEHYIEGDKDTKSNDVLEHTYKPSLLTFEQDICKTMRIDDDDDRQLKPTYWY